MKPVSPRRSVLFTLGVVALILVLINHNMDGAIRRVFPRPRFSADMIPPQKGRVALITGANVGLGRETAFQLAKKGAKVVLACRSSCDAVVDEIKKTGGDAIAMKLDLGDSKSIAEFAANYRKTGLPIHMLILNAGVMMMPEFTPTKDGFEMQVGVNWLGHFYLQQLLQDIVEQSAPSRVVIVTSKGHEFAPSTLPIGLTVMDTPDNRAAYGAMRNYGISKVLNILHAKELDARMRMANKQVSVIAVHPGAVDTELGRHLEEFVKRNFGAKFVLWTRSLVEMLILPVQDGALTQLWAATSPEVIAKNLSGSYSVPIGRVVASSALSQDIELRERVWNEGLGFIKNFQPLPKQPEPKVKSEKKAKTAKD